MSNDMLTCRIAHLAMLQAVIARMASYSLGIKGVCGTIVAALIALYLGKNDFNFLLLAFVPILLFAHLDTEYLILERGFRNHYETIRHAQSAHEIDFSIKPTGIENYFKVLVSWSVLSFYAPILMLLGLLIFMGK